MTGTTPPTATKHHIIQSFNRAADRYDSYSWLQKQVAQKLLAYLHKTGRSFTNIIDIGAGTGLVSQMIADRLCPERMILCDLAHNMLKQAQNSLADNAGLVLADFDQLPLQTASQDLIFSSMAIQWSLELAKTVRELDRITKPGGVIAIALPIEGTMAELSQACRAVGHPQPANNFFSQSHITNTVSTTGLTVLHQGSETCRYDFGDIFSLVRSLKAIGANTLKYHKKPHSYTKSLLHDLEKYYPIENGTLPLSYRIHYLIAQKEV